MQYLLTKVQEAWLLESLKS